MKKYRKKPIVIEAEQFNGKDLIPPMYFSTNPKLRGTPMIYTLEGGLKVSKGDWIITGIKGEHYPCKPDIFEATYEEVKE